MKANPMARILVIEDNEMNREILSRRLAKIGHQVLMAVDGAEGIQAAVQELPDLILMDMSLPGIDGWEATRELRSRKATTSIPVIAITAHALPGDRARTLEAGCDEYETKPIEFASLIHKIERLLARDANSC